MNCCIFECEESWKNILKKTHLRVEESRKSKCGIYENSFRRLLVFGLSEFGFWVCVCVKESSLSKDRKIMQLFPGLVEKHRRLGTSLHGWIERIMFWIEQRVSRPSMVIQISKTIRNQSNNSTDQRILLDKRIKINAQDSTKTVIAPIRIFAFYFRTFLAFIWFYLDAYKEIILMEYARE